MNIVNVKVGSAMKVDVAVCNKRASIGSLVKMMNDITFSGEAMSH